MTGWEIKGNKNVFARPFFGRSPSSPRRNAAGLRRDPTEVKHVKYLTKADNLEVTYKIR